MSRKHGGAVLVLAAVLGVVAVPAVARAEPGPPDPAVIERYVTEHAKRAGYPGVAIAITKGDKVILTAGYGHDSSGAPVTARTPMPVASVSKSFTALAVLRLVEAGRVALDAPVRDYLPEFRVADPRGARITVRMLLNHTSGISDATHPEKSLPQPDSLAGAVERARTAKLATEPGTKYAYTNTNYHVAARLVEAVAGEPFADHLRRHVLEPLGMRASTTIDLAPRDIPGTLRKGHIYAYGMSVAATEPKRFVNGSDGLITTAEDFAQWLIVQHNGGRAAGGTQLVSAGSIKAMHTSSDPRWTSGLGWNTDPRGRVGHTGIWFTYTASQVLLPSGYGIAVLSNSGVGLGNEGTSALQDGLATLLEGGTPAAGAPVRLIIDLVLAGLTLLSLALGVRTVRRSRAWARRMTGRPVWRLALRLVPRFIPAVLLVELPALIGLLFGGRDLAHGAQFAYFSVALVTWSTVATLTGLAVVLARVRALLHRPRAKTAPAAVAAVAAT